MNIEKKHIHFIGIGGAGMSGLAEILLTKGYKVSGSDVAENAATKHLQSLGANIVQGHRSENGVNADKVIYSSAVAKDNPELLAAQKAHIPILGRGQLLAELVNQSYGIAIGGTHGKTTTTGLVTSLLAEGGLDPTFAIGGLLRSAGANARLGSGKYFVAEADESDASFLYLKPQIAVVTNIDQDHLNNYESFAALKESFLQFVNQVADNGLAVVCSDDAYIKAFLNKITRPFITYGFHADDDVRASAYHQNGISTQITVERRGKLPLLVTLNMPGRHNVLNALAAIAVATHCGVDDAAICRALANFQGTGRRFQMYGELKIGEGQVMLIDDYGHHPNEIAATLQAIRDAWPKRRLVLAFQPHRYSRTQAIFDDFVKILAEPDLLLLLDIYSAGETPIPGVTSLLLCEAIQKTSKLAPVFVKKVQELPDVLQKVLKDGDILLTQGAGDIGKIAPALAAGKTID